jgi:hypothetical protein
MTWEFSVWPLLYKVCSFTHKTPKDTLHKQCISKWFIILEHGLEIHWQPLSCIFPLMMKHSKWQVPVYFRAFLHCVG